MRGILFLFAVTILLQTTRRGVESLVVPPPPTGLLIVGLGRVGKDCARAAILQFPENSIVGTIRQEKFRDEQQEDHDGIRRIPCQAGAVAEWLANSKCSHVLLTVQPPSDDEEDPLMEVFNTIEKNLVEGGWIGVISTSGVYGDHQGRWVDENSELLCNAESNAGRYVAYENDWKHRVKERNHRLCIFRCGGIYDNSRSALHTIRKKGYAPMMVQKAKESSLSSLANDITNRIHSTDIARAVLASMLQQGSDPYRIYNLADDLPESRRVVMEYAYQLLQSAGIDVPLPAEEREKKSSIRSSRRKTDRKLVSNERMRKELLPKDGLLYPTYREGLKAILDGWIEQEQ